MRKIYTMGRYFKAKFRTKVYKVPISISSFTCPNIDGRVAKGGCSFCENHSFSPNLKNEKDKFYLNSDTKNNPYIDKQLKELKEQFQETSKILKEKNGAKKFIIYFQSFTNTYAPFETLKILYDEALKLKNVIGLSIGTRTDCIDEKILKYLQELSKKNEIWLEYGIQSTNDKTLEIINRGHNVENIKYWIKKTKEYNLNICGHIIFGLPDETEKDMLKSIQESVELGIDSIKIHPLYVVKNTILTNSFINGKFTPISYEKYADILVKALKLIPENISIQRITAGIESDTLLAPEWCRQSKNLQMKIIKKILQKNNICY